AGLGEGRQGAVLLPERGQVQDALRHLRFQRPGGAGRWRPVAYVLRHPPLRRRRGRHADRTGAQGGRLSSNRQSAPPRRRARHHDNRHGDTMGKGRLEAFSDGVLAIIITIMVLELEAPEGATLDALAPLAPSLLSYVLSFLYVGIYWNNHHHLLQACK